MQRHSATSAGIAVDSHTALACRVVGAPAACGRVDEVSWEACIASAGGCHIGAHSSHSSGHKPVAYRTGSGVSSLETAQNNQSLVTDLDWAEYGKRVVEGRQPWHLD